MKQKEFENNYVVDNSPEACARRVAEVAHLPNIPSSMTDMNFRGTIRLISKHIKEQNPTGDEE